MSREPDDMQPRVDDKLKRRNRAVGLALGAFVVVLMVVSYFRIKGLVP